VSQVGSKVRHGRNVIGPFEFLEDPSLFRTITASFFMAPLLAGRIPFFALVFHENETFSAFSRAFLVF
jgi:hypothetical protein